MFHQGNAPLANGLKRAQLPLLSNAEFESNHGFIQWAYPTNRPSTEITQAPTLELHEAIWLAEQTDFTRFLEDMTERFVNFLNFNIHWLCSYDHNHLRISRALHSLRLLHSFELAEWLQDNVYRISDGAKNELAAANQYWQTNLSQKHDRISGTFLGLAIGDALGAPLEFKERGTFEPISSYNAGGRFNLPAGAWTDDTAMALCLAQSLIETKTYDPADALKRYCRWAETGENSSTGVAVGIGQNTLRALGDFNRTGRLDALPHGAKNDGNGSIMRLAPIPIAFHNSQSQTIESAILQSRSTHASVLAERSCAFLAEIVYKLINGQDYAQAKSSTLARYVGTQIQHELRVSFSEVPADQICSTGFVLDTLKAAMWAVENSNSPKDAIILAINLGGDADTVGAVTGQIVGAMYGYAAFPQELKSGLVRERELYVTSQYLSDLSR